MDQLREWVEEYSNQLFQWARYKTGRDETAEDLVQDTFLAAASGLARFEGKSSPKTWLFSILNNKIVDYYRKQTRNILSLDNEKASRGFELSEHMFDQDGGWQDVDHFQFWQDDTNLLDDAGFQAAMKYCMEHLPDNWRLILTAKYLLEKPGKDICQEMDISPSNYWQILHRTKLLMKKCLEENWFERQ